ncbi:uncharacterized mitochondrial protein-like protein [Tanacetum coccineum]
MIGALMYLTSSIPDIVHAACLCARYQAQPTEKHLKEVKRIFRYLRGIVNMGLWYTMDSGFELTGFSNADYAGCQDSFKSTSGEAQFLGEKLVEQLTKDFQAKAAKEVPNLFVSIGHCKVIFADNDAQSDDISSNETNELRGVSFLSDHNMQVSKKENEGPSGVLPCQLPLKGLIEMTDMSKKAPMGIVDNVLVKIDKLVFPSDFVIIDMLRDPNETMILGRLFLATIYARINVFRGEISLGIGEDMILFDMNGNVHHPTVPIKKVSKGKTIMAEPGTIIWRLYSCKLVRVMGNDTCRFWPTCDPNLKDCNRGDSTYGVDKHGVPKHWYGNSKIDDTTRERGYNGWFAQNNRHLSYSHRSTLKPYPGNYVIAPSEVTNLDYPEIQL